jgi:predicted patatin/cPLA2 family phospholipase
MERDIILIIEGGTMLGFFGGGVVTAFQEANLYPRLHSVYAVSSGAHDAAYFLSRQTSFGSSIYYEDLVGGRFIHAADFWKYIKGVFCPHHAKRISLIDIDYLAEVESTTKKLDVAAIANSAVPFFIQVLDVRDGRHVYLDGTRDTIRALKATASVVPFYSQATEINGVPYVDSGTIRTKDFLDIIKQHPDKKVVYISNRDSTFLSELCRLPLLFFQAILTARLFGLSIGTKSFLSSLRFLSAKELRAYPNVYLVLNDMYHNSVLTSSEKIREIYSFGITKGKEALEKLAIS